MSAEQKKKDDAGVVFDNREQYVAGDQHQAGHDIHINGIKASRTQAKTVEELFRQLSSMIDELPEEEQDLLSEPLRKLESSIEEIKSGDTSEKTLRFFEARLQAIYRMRHDIGEVAITTLASPALGLAMIAHKVAQKVEKKLNLRTNE